MTIRRDLQELEALGVARRVRGGAVAVGPLAFADRHRARARAKAKIAAKLLDTCRTPAPSASTRRRRCLRLATAVEEGRDLVVLTNGWETFKSLQGKPGLTRGAHRRSTRRTDRQPRRTGRGALRHQRAADPAVHLGRGGPPRLRPERAHLEEAEVKRSLATVASDVVLAADSSKLLTRSVARSIDWADIALLVTELDPKDKRLDDYRDLVELR